MTFDATSSGSGSGTSLTVSHTNGGNILWVGVDCYKAASGTGDLVTGVTYNGVAMTQSDKKAYPPGDEQIYLYYLVAPAAGANNIVVSASASDYLGVNATSYTSAKQTGVPDAHATNNGSSVTSLTTSVTTVADNCWLVGYVKAGASPSAGTNTTLRGSVVASAAIGDSNAAQTPAGSKSLQFTFSSSSPAMIVASFAPAPAVSGGMMAFFQ